MCCAVTVSFEVGLSAIAPRTLSKAWDTSWYPCPDSNRGARFRKPVLYPPELQGHTNVARQHTDFGREHKPMSICDTLRNRPRLPRRYPLDAIDAILAPNTHSHESGNPERHAAANLDSPNDLANWNHFTFPHPEAVSWQSVVQSPSTAYPNHREANHFYFQKTKKGGAQSD